MKKELAEELDEEIKGIKVNVRLDEETSEKLNEIMKARGLSKSDAVRFCIKQIPIIQFGNIKDLALEFCQIREALETGNYDAQTSEEVNMLCRYISDLLEKVEG